MWIEKNENEIEKSFKGSSISKCLIITVCPKTLLLRTFKWHLLKQSQFFSLGCNGDIPVSRRSLSGLTWPPARPTGPLLTSCRSRPPPLPQHLPTPTPPTTPAGCTPATPPVPPSFIPLSSSGGLRGRTQQINTTNKWTSDDTICFKIIQVSLTV